MEVTAEPGTPGAAGPARRQGAGRGLEQPGADPGHPVEAGQGRRTAAVGLAIGHDHLGEREAHPGQPGELGGGWPGRRRSARPGRGAGASARMLSRWARGERGGSAARSWTSPGGCARASQPPADTLAQRAPGPAAAAARDARRRTWRATIQRCGGPSTDAGASGRNRARRRRNRRATSLPPHQRHRHVAHDLQARGAHLVDRVVLGVPGGIVEVHHVDGPDAGLLQLQVVVDQRVLRAWR